MKFLSEEENKRVENFSQPDDKKISVTFAKYERTEMISKIKKQNKNSQSLQKRIGSLFFLIFFRKYRLPK